MSALNIANYAIIGSADMATKIRTEYDVELDLLEVQKKLETIHKHNTKFSKIKPIKS